MRNLMLNLLAVYKQYVSPLLPVACRYTPTCSDYAAEALARHGAIGGMWLALWRLLRCNPLGGRGLDPVPEHLSCCGAANAPAARIHSNEKNARTGEGRAHGQEFQI
jgi:uncharacterized protein